MTALLNLAEAQREFQKVSPQAKVSDFALLDGMAKDIIRAAKLISAVAPFIDGQNMRPSVADLAIRMVEAIDDQLSPEAWTVVAAGVRLGLEK